MESNKNKNRPKLSAHEQIEHLKKKGIKFDIIREEEAERYLIENNNYFKLRAYRKNFEKYVSGDKVDTYVNLDFAMLRDLAVIDMRIRYVLLTFALDIEHFEKVKLLNIISDSDDDGYAVVRSYLDDLKYQEDTATDNRHPYSTLIHDIERNHTSDYCGGIIEKYDGNYPVWAFLEIIPFGSFINFLKYCSEYFGNDSLLEDHYLLCDVRRFRNAAAHNSCVIHNLSLHTASNHKTNRNVSSYLTTELNIGSKTRKKRMSSAAIRDIVTLLYTHKQVVTSDGVFTARKNDIKSVIDRCFKNIDYYQNNELVKCSFEFLKKVVDNLYDL